MMRTLLHQFSMHVRRWSRSAPSLLATLALAPLLALALAGCGAQAGDWRLIGPDDGAHVYTVAADPHVAGLIYAGADDGGVYRGLADQSGRVASGEGIPRSAVVASLLPDPLHAGVILAGTSAGLYRSADYGDHWSVYGSGLPAGKAQVALATTPNDATLLAGIDHGGLYRSVNAGAAWAISDAGLPSEATPVALIWDGTDHLWLAGLVSASGAPLFVSADDGQTWAARVTGLPAGAQVNALAELASQGSAGATTLFAATTQGLYRSADAGQRWTQVAGLPGGSALALATLPQQPTWLYVSVGASIFRSTDGGAHWQSVATGLTTNAQGLAVTEGKQSGPVVYVAAGQVARYPTGVGASNGFPTGLAFVVIALGLVAGGYMISRRSRRFGYAMGALRNERNTGRTAEEADRWSRERTGQSTGAPDRGRRAGADSRPDVQHSERRVLAPTELTSRATTGDPADEGKASQNGHGKPKQRS